ncbi:unnamed protein product [Chilo suppressalis]|uniref:Uncharacterized protein n=1 Tax=Chilo suppressalis TaxID=168631 RepID=A0ABN8AWZ4_CHISP|nr:unnamed protein product [Chilo suppressalis]
MPAFQTSKSRYEADHWCHYPITSRGEDWVMTRTSAPIAGYPIPCLPHSPLSHSLIIHSNNDEKIPTTAKYYLRYNRPQLRHNLPQQGEFGCTLLGSLPKSHRERLNRELREMIRCIKQHNESVDNENNKAKENNKSASMVELNTPEKRLFQPKVDTPTRYRSLDTLTTAKDAAEPQLPEPRPLAKQLIGYTEEEMNDHKARRYEVRWNQQSTLLESLIEAEKVAENLRNKLAFVIKEYVEEGKCDSSMSSLALDMSRISVLKGEPGKQFASSPNLSGLGKAQNDFTKSRIKRFDSASTSNLLAKKPPPNEKPSKLRRLSPNIFNKAKKDGVKSDKNPPKIPDNKSSKIGSLFRPKIVTPVSRPPESSPNLSTAKRKFNHIKSTIPRPTPVKKDRPLSRASAALVAASSFSRLLACGPCAATLIHKNQNCKHVYGLPDDGTRRPSVPFL